MTTVGMGKKGYKSTWRDPSLYGGPVSFRPTGRPATEEYPRNSQSFSSDSTVNGGRRDLSGPWRPRIQDKDAHRGTSQLDYPSSKPDERHAPWDEVSDEEEDEQQENDAETTTSDAPKISILSRSNLKAHETENDDSTGPVEFQPAVSVSDLIELESHHYDDEVDVDLAAQKDAEDEIFDSNDVALETLESANVDTTVDGSFHNSDVNRPMSDNNDIPHTQKTVRQYAQPFFEQSLPDEDNVPDTNQSERVSNGRSSTFEDRNLDVKLEPTQEITRASQSRGATVGTVTSHIAPDGSTYFHYKEGEKSTAINPVPAWSAGKQTDLPASSTVGYKLNPAVSAFSIVRSTETQYKQIESEEDNWRCENDAIAERPQAGRPNTKVIVFAVSTSRDNRRGESDMFSVHSHLIRLFWPLMAIAAHRNEYVRSDGSFMVDSDSIVSKEFSIFVHWLYTGKLLDDNNDPLSSGTLIRLYKFGVREDLPFLRDDVMTALFKFSRNHADWKPTPVLFDKFPSDSMICKFVAVTWANHAKELQGVDINKMIQASTKGPAPIIEFMRMAWAEANVGGNNPGAVRRSPCDFHEHAEMRHEDDAPNKILWDWL